jgi:hypothetical protein
MGPQKEARMNGETQPGVSVDRTLRPEGLLLRRMRTLGWYSPAYWLRLRNLS